MVGEAEDVVSREEAEVAGQEDEGVEEGDEEDIQKNN